MIRNFFLVVFLFCVGMCAASAATTATVDNFSSPTSVKTIPPTESASSATQATPQNSPVNLNAADATEIMTLKGIGQVKADAIVAYRQQNGNFKEVNDLTKVKGFSQKTVQKLENNNPGRVLIK